MTFGQRQALAQRLRAIPLETVLSHCGAQPDRYDPHKWHTSAGVLSVTAAKFINWSSHASGGGAIDLVITDICMPGGSGTQLLHKVRNLFPGVDVLLMTAHSAICDLRQAVEEGAVGLMRKPRRARHVLHRQHACLL